MNQTDLSALQRDYDIKQDPFYDDDEEEREEHDDDSWKDEFGDEEC